MARQGPQDAAGYPNTARPPGGGAYPSGYNPYTGNQYLVNRQYARGQQGDTRQMRPRNTGRGPASNDILVRPRLPRDAQGRANIYGSSNPYRTSTNPYEGIAWLGSGFPHPLPRVPPQAPVAPSFAPVQPGGARPSWDLAGIGALLGPYFHIPITEDYNLNKKIREAIPLIDAAILRMKDLIGFPDVEAAPRLKRDIGDFLQALPNNRLLQGAQTWARSHLDNAFTYGRAHAEVILTADRRDVFGLVEVHPTTTGLRPTFDGYAVNVVQYQFGGGVPITLVPELLLTSVHDFRGDDPNGTSLIGSLPFVSEILIKMFRAHGQLWERYGVPNYHVNWVPPDDWNDPEGEQTQAILAPMQQNLYQSDIDRANGKIRHFWTTGQVSVDVMGAAEQQLHFETTAKVFSEQITAKTGLPPFMLGLSWSTTERMSTAQAKLLTEVIEAARMMMEPCIRQLIDLRQRLVGRTGQYTLVWPKVSLQDLIDMSRAAWMDAQAEQIRLENWDRKVRIGINSLEEMAQEFREDLGNVPLKQIRERLNGTDGLPKLLEELPAPVTPASGQGPGRATDMTPGGNNPRDESTRALVLKEMREVMVQGNGNGKH